MASSNRLVVEVVGDTHKLTSSLTQAQQQINRFATTTKKSTSALEEAFKGNFVEGPIRQVSALDQAIRGAARDQQNALAATREESIRTAAAVDAHQAAMRRFAVGAAVAGVAVNVLGRNFAEMGGEAGKFGRAMSALSTGNIVGFIKAANDGAAGVENFGKQLVTQGDFAKANAEANKLAAAGLDDLAKSARAAADQIAAVEDAQRTQSAAAALAGTTGGFGITPLDPLLGTSKDPAKRKGITASQRNTFFDNAIARELDRAQDLAPRLQIKRLQEVRKEIEAKIAQTKDPTRRLTLGDEIAQIDREVGSLNEGIAAALRATAKRLAEARRKRIALLKSQAEDIKSAVLDAFDTKTDKIDNARNLADAKKILRKARQLGGPDQLETALRGVQDANRAITRQRILDTSFSVGEGPRGPVNAVTVGNITFNIATSDPDKVAAIVLKKLQASGRNNGTQGRGRTPGRGFGTF